LKKVLIISPYFPPSNTADLHRVRQSLSYFKMYGWDAEVVTTDEQYADMPKDDLLLQSMPVDVVVHKVPALSKAMTAKLGLGSIALRSLIYYRNKVNNLLNTGGYQLIYFSTTQFPVCILGGYWNKRYHIPYVIDMQDPWHSNYYEDKPKQQQPSKYWLSYRLNKYTEALAMKRVNGLISVSADYIEILKERYPRLKNIPSATITFGAFEPDLQIAAANASRFNPILTPGFKNIVYLGRGGMDLYNAIKSVFDVLKKGLSETPDLYGRLRFYFIGTSYAPAGQGQPTILPLAKECGVENSIVEITDRIGYYDGLATLQQSDALFIPGSDDISYTASKIFPCLLTKKPLLSIFNSKSSAIGILKEFNAKQTYSYDQTPDLYKKIELFFAELLNGNVPEEQYSPGAMEKYSAKMMTKHQCDLFDRVIYSDN